MFNLRIDDNSIIEQQDSQYVACYKLWLTSLYFRLTDDIKREKKNLAPVFFKTEEFYDYCETLNLSPCYVEQAYIKRRIASSRVRTVYSATNKQKKKKTGESTSITRSRSALCAAVSL